MKRWMSFPGNAIRHRVAQMQLLLVCWSRSFAAFSPLLPEYPPSIPLFLVFLPLLLLSKWIWQTWHVGKRSVGRTQYC
jgi:hypothetical protein